LHEDRRPFDRFTIGYLAEFTPPLETIDADARICDAIEIMCKKNYSQLPIIQKNNDGSETCVGVVTMLSFLQGFSLQYDKGNGEMRKIMESNVVTFKVPDEPVFAQPSDEILEYVDLLSKEDFVLVGSRSKCASIITNSDVVSFFKNKTEVFLLLREIETSLRYIISKCLAGDKLKETLDSLASSRKERKITVSLRDVADLFQDELRAIINKNWNEFQKCFKDKEKIGNQLEYVRDLRNKVFHFRSQITGSELTHIKMLRDNFAKIAENVSGGE
jgi:predicted transcriptional regulator